MKLQKYKTLNGQWAWRLRADNGKIIADSAESYVRERSCDEAIVRVLAGFKAGVTASTTPPVTDRKHSARRVLRKLADTPREKRNIVSVAGPADFRVKL